MFPQWKAIQEEKLCREEEKSRKLLTYLLMELSPS
jgi:hypothetical protein